MKFDFNAAGNGVDIDLSVKDKRTLEAARVVLGKIALLPCNEADFAKEAEMGINAVLNGPEKEELPY